MVEKKHTGGRTKGDGKGKTGGRKQGTPNKVTKEAREILACIVDGNAEKAQEKLDRITDPKTWILCYVKLAEFVVPKMESVNVSAVAPRSDLRSELLELANREED